MGDLSGPWTVVVPVYNGSERIQNLYTSLCNLVDSGSLSGDGELLFVDDASTDASWKIICSLSISSGSGAMGGSSLNGRLPVSGVRLSRRRGQQAALLAGLFSAVPASAHRIIITMDDDLSHPAASIPSLLQALSRPGVDMAYAQPPRRPGGRLRRTLSRMHQLNLCLLTAAPLHVRVCSFRSLNASLVNRILRAPFCYPYLSAMALSLRPAPQTAMIPTPEWPPSGSRRFNAASLMRLEANLALHYNPAARLIRACGKRRKASVADVVSGWISECCGGCADYVLQTTNAVLSTDDCEGFAE